MEKTKSKPRGKPFEKGNKLGQGRPKLPEEIRTLVRATGEEALTSLCYVFSAPHQDVQALANNLATPSGLKAMASCLDNCIATGDSRLLSSFLERLLGKAKETLEVSSADENGFRVIIQDYSSKKSE